MVLSDLTEEIHFQDVTHEYIFEYSRAETVPQNYWNITKFVSCYLLYTENILTAHYLLMKIYYSHRILCQLGAASYFRVLSRLW